MTPFKINVSVERSCYTTCSPSTLMVAFNHLKKPRISTCQLLVPPCHSVHSILKRQRQEEMREKERKKGEGEEEQIMEGRKREVEKVRGKERGKERKKKRGS